MKWLKDSNGNPSASVTLLLVSFIAVTLAYVANMIGEIGGYSFKPFDVAATGAYFGTIVALYGGRRWTKAKYGDRSLEVEENGSEE